MIVCFDLVLWVDWHQLYAMTWFANTWYMFSNTWCRALFVLVSYALMLPWMILILSVYHICWSCSLCSPMCVICVWCMCWGGASVKGKLFRFMIYLMIMLFLLIIACCESCVANIKKGEIVGIRCFDVSFMCPHDLIAWYAYMIVYGRTNRLLSVASDPYCKDDDQSLYESTIIKDQSSRAQER